MSAYFTHEFISNSDLQKLKLMGTDYVEPANLSLIFEQGTLNHDALNEPWKAKNWFADKILNSVSSEDRDKTEQDYNLAMAMAKTVLADSLCRQIIMAPDYKREHEFYRRNCLGFHGTRCKADGVSKRLGIIFEYKGLALSTENAFDSAIDYHDYDQASVLYTNTAQLPLWLIVGVSKKYPDRLFKRLVDKNHRIYQSGEIKLEKAKEKYRLLVGEVQ